MLKKLLSKWIDRHCDGQQKPWANSTINEHNKLKNQPFKTLFRFSVKNLSLVFLFIFHSIRIKSYKLIILYLILACLSFLPFGESNNAFSFEKSSVCISEIEKYEKLYRIPRGLLGAISKVESSYNPIAINYNGTTIFKNTKDEALNEIKGLVAKGERNIDIGCMQLNVRWHGKYFESLDEMFNSRNNVRYAASFLKGLFYRHGSWYKAVRYYHSANIEAQNNYSARIIEVWTNQGKSKW